MLATNYNGENRRNFFRINFDTPLCGSMKIVEYHGKEIDSGYTNICITNISAGGLAFLSKLSFPIDEDIVLNFQLKILNKTFYLNGTIVRKSTFSDNIYIYGIKFLIDKSYQNDFISLLNQLSIKLRRNDFKSAGCDFCKKETIPCT